MSQIGALVSGLWGDAGLNFTNEAGGKDAVFGTKPLVADYKPIDLSDETAKAVAANLENLPEISALLDKIIPGFSDILAQGSENTLSQLHGEIPPDVLAQIQRSSAFKATQGGFGGTAMGKALTARDIGRTSLDLTTMGANSAQIWAKLAEEAYSPFTVSSGQQAGTTAANNAGIQAQKQFQFNVDAAPDPGAAGVFGLDKELGMQMLSFGMGAAGGAIAGGGGAAAGYGMPAGSTATPGSTGYLSSGGIAYGNVPSWYTQPTWGGGG